MSKNSGMHLSKQDFAIKDSTAAVRGVAWENHHDKQSCNVLKENLVNVAKAWEKS